MRINTAIEKEIEPVLENIESTLMDNQELFFAAGYIPNKTDIDGHNDSNIISIDYYRGDYEFYFLNDFGEEIEDTLFVITRDSVV